MVYNPQMVLRQLGYDHAMVMVLGALVTLSTLVAKFRFVGEGRYQILASKERMFCPDLVRAGIQSPVESSHGRST